VLVSRANIHDSKCLDELLYRAKAKYKNLKRVLLDKAYRGLDAVGIKHSIDIIISGSYKLSTNIRWKVERSFSWFNWNRRMAKNYEKLSSTMEAMCYISFINTKLKFIS
jgi:hypothetical protein